MGRSNYKNAVRPGTALPPREDVARRPNITNIKIATVQSILFKFSALASAPWHDGYPTRTVTDKQYILQTVRNSSPFVVDLICFERKEGQRKAIGAIVQSFQFPSPSHNLSVCTYPLFHGVLLTPENQVILFRETRTVEIVQEPKPITGDIPFCHWAISLTQAGMDYTKHFWVTLLESLRHLDAEALLYVNIERPIAVAPSNGIQLRSGRLLGQVSDNAKSVAYHIPGEQHKWDFSGHLAKYMFQRQLGHVMGQTHEIVLVGADRAASQKAAKKKRKTAAAAQVVVAIAQKKAKKARKDVRRKVNKQRKRVDWDGAYHPGVPI